MRKTHPVDESRRRFLQRLGAGTAGLVVLRSVGFPASSLAQTCAPPGSPSNAKPWTADCRKIRPRRPASTLASDEVQKLRDAYKAMRDLSTSDPSDPRGFMHQANVHCWNCGGSVQVHHSWQFFAWHRAYLYFHERILGKLIGDPEFRLPYWDWDEPTHRKLPPSYATPSDASNPLWNGTRGMSAGDELPAEDVDDTVMTNVMTLADFADFGGTASIGGVPEGSPHGSVHVDVNGDMGDFDTAARDPVFYAHHANVDKIWSDWNKGASTHLNPSDPAFLNLTFTFFDENKAWRSIKASQVLDHEAQLRYVYGPSRLIELLPCLLVLWHPLRVRWLANRTLVLTRDIRNRMQVQGREANGVRLQFDQPSLPLNKSAVYRVYADRREAEQDRGPESPAYVGVVPVVLNDAKNRHPVRRPPRMMFNLTKRWEPIFRAESPIEFFIVERGVEPAARRVLPLRARTAQLAVAEVEE